MKLMRYSRQKYETFEYLFSDKQDLINYLKNPKVSSAFKKEDLHSMRTSSEMIKFTSTKSMAHALKLYEDGWYEEFDSFLRLKKKIDKQFPYIAYKKESYNSVVGGYPNIFNSINNIPQNMRKSHLVKMNNRDITIYVNSAYPWHTTETQLLHSGIITLATMEFLKKIGYNVEIDFFEFVTCSSQAVLIKSIVKKRGTRLNLQNLYFPFCNPSYLRRFLFRVLESTEGLHQYWKNGYGSCPNQDQTRDFLDIKENELLISYPKNMGIKGENLSEDIDIFLNKININKYIENSKAGNTKVYRR